MILEKETKLNKLGVVVADHISAMLAYWDNDLVCRFANAAYLDWFGKKKDELIDKMTLPELLGPLYEKNRPYIEKALQGETQVFERDIPTPSGHIRHSLANYIPDIQDGQVQGFFVHVADITAIKTLEIQLLSSNEIIIEQNKRLMNFANIVSHNLKSYANNLNSLLGIFSTSNSEEEKLKVIDLLQGLAKGFSTTISNLDEIVEVQDSNHIKKQVTNLRQTLDSVLSIISVQVLETKTLIINNIRNDFFIRTNAAYLESILINLLTNAIKYRSPSRNLQIELNCHSNFSDIEIQIRDNGSGIDLQKHRHDIFGMYKKFHGNPDAKGLGLFITRLQVVALGGRIEVESEVDHGTTFSVHLPSN